MFTCWFRESVKIRGHFRKGGHLSRGDMAQWWVFGPHSVPL